MARKTQYVILGLLTENPLSGYDIKKIIDIRFKFFWQESYGQIYPELKRMMDEGLIKSQSHASDRGKQVYQITDNGYDELKKWMHQKPETESIRLEILLKRYFAEVVDSSIMIQHIEEFQRQHNQELQILNQFKYELESIDDPYHNHSDILSVIDFGIKTNTAYLDWSQETILKLKKK
jgi:PadR family transcriptional regulator, regulatory protein AphA